MRILSQEGLTFNDVPYEKFVFGIARDRGTDKFCVVAREESVVSESCFPLNGVMAEYSTEAKSRKAMEMLRNAYSPKIEIKETVKKEIPKSKVSDWCWTVKEPRIEVLSNVYFQFPQDSEIEV